jgi:hypothetical protein
MSVVARVANLTVAAADARPLVQLTDAIDCEDTVLRHPKRLAELHALLERCLTLVRAVPRSAALAAAERNDGLALQAVERALKNKETERNARRLVSQFVERALAAKRTAFRNLQGRYLASGSEPLTMVDLGLGIAIAVSSNGLATGYSGTGPVHTAFVGNGSTTFRLFDTPDSVGFVVRNDGVVAGAAEGQPWLGDAAGGHVLSGLGGRAGPDTGIRAFGAGSWWGASNSPSGVETPTRWDGDGVPAVVPRGPASGSVFGVDATGDLVGTMFVARQRFHAYLQPRQGRAVDLGTPAGGEYSAGHAVNDLREVGGTAWYAGAAIATGELWWGSRRLSFTSAPTDSYVAAVNNAGWAVGGVGSRSSHHGALFVYGRVVDVNTLIPSSGALTVVSVNGINDSGVMVGTADDPVGEPHAVMLFPAG